MAWAPPHPVLLGFDSPSVLITLPQDQPFPSSCPPCSGPSSSLQPPLCSISVTEPTGPLLCPQLLTSETPSTRVSQITTSPSHVFLSAALPSNPVSCACTSPHVPLGACPPPSSHLHPQAHHPVFSELPGPTEGRVATLATHLPESCSALQPASQPDHAPKALTLLRVPQAPFYLLSAESLTAHLTEKAQAFPQGLPQVSLPCLVAPSHHPSLSPSAADLPPPQHN